MSDQPGSAPSERPGAKETMTQRQIRLLEHTLAEHKRFGFNAPMPETENQLRALRLLARVQEFNLEGMKDDLYQRGAQRDPVWFFLKDLAAIADPTDAGER